MTNHSPIFRILWRQNAKSLFLWSERRDSNPRPLSPQNSPDMQNRENARENGLFCSIPFRFGSRQKFATFRIRICAYV
jgi:hypothetical protein